MKAVSSWGSSRILRWVLFAMGVYFIADFLYAAWGPVGTWDGWRAARGLISFLLGFWVHRGKGR